MLSRLSVKSSEMALEDDDDTEISLTEITLEDSLTIKIGSRNTHQLRPPESQAVHGYEMASQEESSPGRSEGLL